MMPTLLDVARDVVTDHGDQCDHPDDCGCSMARLTRLVAELDRVLEEWTPDPSTIRVIPTPARTWSGPDSASNQDQDEEGEGE